jgi:hypothetical protein
MAGYKCLRLSRHTAPPIMELHRPLKKQETAQGALKNKVYRSGGISPVLLTPQSGNCVSCFLARPKLFLNSS